MIEMPTWARRWRLPAAALLAAFFALTLVLAGCSGSSGASDSAELPGAAYDGGGADQAAGEGSAPDAPGVSADADQMVIVTGYVTVVVTDPIAASGEVAALVEREGGRVSSRSQQAATGGNRPYAQLTARIPAENVSDVLAALEELGTVRESQLDSVEVTAQVRDLDARIRATEISVARLEDLLARSGELADIVAAEQVLTDRQSELEQLESERASLADQVALSTVTVNLYTDEAVPDEPPSGFLAGLATGWKAMVSFLTWLVSTVGVLLPWLVLGAVVAAVALPLVRRSRRRAAARASVRVAASAAAAGRGPTTSLPPTPPAPAPGPVAQGPDTGSASD